MENNIYNLSYIICTRNRCQFLKIAVEKLIEIKLPDEEIVVVDGNSNDGTKEYLQSLYEQGLIQQYISEPDKNQAHGWNKAMLLAKGVLIKKIIDDDVFCYSAIRECKNYMLAHINVDACISNSLTIRLGNTEIQTENTRFSFFKDWKAGNTKSFTFSDVYLILRRSSLAYLGLYNTKFTMLDWEYSLRISHLKANIIYYTGFMAMGVDTPGNVTSVTPKNVLLQEGAIGAFLYDYAGDGAEISSWSRIKIAVGKFLDRHKHKENKALNTDETINLTDFYKTAYSIIETKNLNTICHFY